VEGGGKVKGKGRGGSGEEGGTWRVERSREREGGEGATSLERR